jgi:hypothetical protein
MMTHGTFYRQRRGELQVDSPHETEGANLGSWRDVLDEFDWFVQSLRGVAVDYNVIVLVEGKAPRQLHSEYNTTEPKTARERPGA